MDVVFGHVSADDLYAVGTADFSYQISRSDTDSSFQYGLLVLGGPYQVIFEVKDGVGTLAIELHVASIAS